MDPINQVLAEARARILHQRPPPPPQPSAAANANPPGNLAEEDAESLHFLTCPVHLREFDTEDHQPHVIFPCGHTVCREVCIRESRCPLCRVSFRNHAVNRGLLEVIQTMNAPLPIAEPEVKNNQFLVVLQRRRGVLETMKVDCKHWNGTEWAVFHELLHALKTHANHATRVWVDASGCHGHLACELRRRLVQIKRVVFNRRRLGWEDLEGLPMCLN